MGLIICPRIFSIAVITILLFARLAISSSEFDLIKSVHSKSEEKKHLPEPTSVYTFAGKLHIEWDPSATVTPMGQLHFFIQLLKLDGQFKPWIDDCPLQYKSNNAPEKIDVLGSFFYLFCQGRNVMLTSTIL